MPFIRNEIYIFILPKMTNFSTQTTALQKKGGGGGAMISED
jgi:hypothetical protein